LTLEILKLGGSVVTDKAIPMSPNIDSIKRLANEISKADSKELIIIHGGGSFGHPLAKDYDIINGYKSDLQLLGFSKTRQAMIQLNSLILNNLLDANIPAVSINPSSIIVTNNKRIKNVNVSVLNRYLQTGFIPVLYGDAVLDNKRRFTILSGDQLAVKLSILLKVERIIFGVDVDGVYSTNPKLSPQARLIEDLSLKEMKDIIKIGNALPTDVTGGMLGKIKEAEKAVNFGVKVLLVNALKPDYIYRALRYENVISTTLKR